MGFACTRGWRCRNARTVAERRNQLGRACMNRTIPRDALAAAPAPTPSLSCDDLASGGMPSVGSTVTAPDTAQ